jgi:hypothetical protein
MTDLELSLITFSWLAADLGLLLILPWIADDEDESW